MQTKTVETIAALLNAWADEPDTKEFDDGLYNLSECAIEEGVVNWYVAGGYTVPDAEAPEAPPMPVISPATVGRIVEALNVNASFLLSKDCGALANVRNSMIKEGLIACVDGDECKSLVGKVSEAPVAPIEWLGDDFDI